MSQFRVTTTLESRNATHPDYPLLKGDIVVRDPDMGWMKVAPGLAIGGFLLSDEDLATLEPADDVRWGLL